MVVVMQFALVRSSCNVITASGAWTLESLFSWLALPLPEEKAVAIFLT